GRLAQYVEAQARAAARVRLQQPAQHAYRRGLAAAVGAEKPADPAARDADRHVVHHAPGAETLRQPFDVDDRRVGAHSSLTSTGWPGCRRTASSGDERASMRNRSLARSCLL